MTEATQLVSDTIVLQPLCGTKFETEDGNTGICDRRANHKGDCYGELRDEDDGENANAR